MNVQGTFSESLIKKLKAKAERTVKDPEDDFDFDTGKDGYDMGNDDGETNLAREILNELGIDYAVPHG